MMMRIKAFHTLMTFVFGALILYCACQPNSPNIQKKLTPRTADTLLGAYLFYDTDLSADRRLSCATCHVPALAFTDGYRRSFTTHADQLPFNSPSLLNLQDYPYFSWKDTSIRTLTQQHHRPLMGTSPPEMYYQSDSTSINTRLSKRYDSLLHQMGQTKISSTIIKHSLAAYVHALQYRNSPYDRYTQDAQQPLEPLAMQGMQLFFSKKWQCDLCHGGRDFNWPMAEEARHYFDIRIPSLRNVSLTSPYFYDGREHSLPRALSQHVDSLRLRFNNYPLLSTNEQKAIISFLHQLTDTSYLSLHPYYIHPQ